MNIETRKIYKMVDTLGQPLPPVSGKGVLYYVSNGKGVFSPETEVLTYTYKNSIRELRLLECSLKSPRYKGGTYGSPHSYGELCIMCQNATGQTKHHLVPYCFDRHFLEVWGKVIHPHDKLVPLCHACHERYERRASRVKKHMTAFITSTSNVEPFKRVVETIESLDDFVVFWREHFIDTTAPFYWPSTFKASRVRWIFLENSPRG